jgi:hypothetical protein
LAERVEHGQGGTVTVVFLATACVLVEVNVATVIDDEDVRSIIVTVTAEPREKSKLVGVAGLLGVFKVIPHTPEELSL